MGKDAGFRIRVERDLRDEFVDVCRTHDRPAAQVIRDPVYPLDACVRKSVNKRPKRLRHLRRNFLFT